MVDHHDDLVDVVTAGEGRIRDDGESRKATQAPCVSMMFDGEEMVEVRRMDRDVGCLGLILSGGVVMERSVVVWSSACNCGVRSKHVA